MHCFNHPDKPAIGICKSCSKGLCPDCATDLDYGLACKNKHEESVKNINLIISKNARIFRTARKSTLIGPAFLLFMGMVFLGSGLFATEWIQWIPVLLGSGFTVFSFVTFFNGRAMWGSKKPKKHHHERDE